MLRRAVKCPSLRSRLTQVTERQNPDKKGRQRMPLLILGQVALAALVVRTIKRDRDNS